MSEAEVRVRASRLAVALWDADPDAVRAALAGTNPIQANRVVRAAAALNGGRLRIG